MFLQKELFIRHFFDTFFMWNVSLHKKEWITTCTSLRNAEPCCYGLFYVRNWSQKLQKCMQNELFIFAIQSSYLRLNDAPRFKNIPAKFQSRPTFLAWFFSKRVIVDDVRRKTFFFTPRGQYCSLSHTVVSMEYRSLPTHSWPCMFPVCRPHAPRTLQHRQPSRHPPASTFVASLNFCLTISSLSNLSFKAKWISSCSTWHCRLIFSVRDMSIAVENFESSLTVRNRVAVRVKANRHTHGGFALSVHKEGHPDVTFQIGKEVVELLVAFIDGRGFQLRVRQPRERRAASLLPSSSGASPKADLQAIVGCLYSSMTASVLQFRFRQTVHVTEKPPCSQQPTLIMHVHFSKGMRPYSEERKGMGIREACRTQESRRVGSFCFEVDQSVLGRSPSSSRGSGACSPGKILEKWSQILQFYAFWQ